METGKKNRDRWILTVVLVVIALICLALWYIPSFYRVQFAELTRVEEEKGVYDLTDVDFSHGFVRLEGDLSYIPEILGPEEFAGQETNAQQGNPQDVPAATSRMVVKVPDDEVYMVVRSSVDYAYRLYLNGQLRTQAGVPAEDRQTFEPGYTQMAEEITPENGAIEILQQGANFVHREGGGHDGVYIGRPETMQRFLALTSGMEAVHVGLFAALFLVHLMLFVVRRSYCANLYFALLCLAWTVRTGLTGSKVFYAALPELPWQLAFRAEYLSLPIACILLIMLVRELFPSVMHTWVFRVVVAAAGAFGLLFVAADTVVMSWALLAFEGMYTVTILYLCIRFVMKVPLMKRSGTLQTEHIVSLIGFGIFFYAAIHDALYHMDVSLPLGFSMTGVAMLLFAFFQMTTMFYGTMRENALAHERERRTSAEKEVLEEMNRLKNQFYTDLSHEMKTPLTVISANAQFAARNLERGTIDEDTVLDLTAISAEARRLAEMVTSLVGLGRMQDGKAERNRLDPETMVRETARIYQSLIAKRGNRLRVEAAQGLPTVVGNGDQMIQVLINLLSNANRHTGNGNISLKIEGLGDRIRIEVIDDGEGISPELLPHVFDRFRRGDGKGSGLGLSICKAIVEDHGGEIGIESEVGKGTRVWFTLPVEPAEEEG
ncbi:MAG: sensor histidine kinase [Bacillota bacterium]|nr:sensor histidine kinase [Bacillota bacterium]